LGVKTLNDFVIIFIKLRVVIRKSIYIMSKDYILIIDKDVGVDKKTLPQGILA
jgi:hypothetical protein